MTNFNDNVSCKFQDINDSSPHLLLARKKVVKKVNLVSVANFGSDLKKAYDKQFIYTTGYRSAGNWPFRSIVEYRIGKPNLCPCPRADILQR